MATDFGQNLQNNLYSIYTPAFRHAVPIYRCKRAIFGSDWSTNPRDYAGSFCNFLDEMAKIDISYHIYRQVLDQTSPFQHLVDGNYNTDISLAVAQGTLLW